MATSFALPVAVGQTPFTPSADAVLRTSSLMAGDWHYDLDNVSKRMGDVRDGTIADAQNGNVWVRAKNYHVNAAAKVGGTGLSQDTWSFTGGADKAFRQSDKTVYAGGFIAVGNSQRNFGDRRANYGNGSTSTIALGGYGLWLYDSGWYMALTSRFILSSNEINARGSDGLVSTAKYSNPTYDLSIELGRRIKFSQIWWFEPQVQVAGACIEGAKYTAVRNKQGVVSGTIEDSIPFQTRAQLMWGVDATPNWKPYARAGIVLSDSDDCYAKVADRRLEADYSGRRFETGVGISYVFSKTASAFLDYEYARAESYERPWTFNAGYCCAW